MIAARFGRIRLPKFLYHDPWPPSSVVAPQWRSPGPIEEEKTPDYDASRFYPARLGQVLGGRYQLATKLGFGANSTVWLARELNRCRWSKEQYVAVKINTIPHNNGQDTAQNELSVLKHLSKQSTLHEGHHFVRTLLDSFTVDGPSGSHLCFVLEPLREPLWLYCRRFVGGVIPSDILKITIQMILEGLDYLHSECKIIHADLKPDNVMIKFEDPTILDRDAMDEYKHPLPQKILEDRTIYLSRNNFGQFTKPTGLVQITDFGHSVSGQVPRTGCIQAESYRAPEVILDAGYTFSADIWSLGVMLWDLLEGNKLFCPVSGVRNEYDDLVHLSQITSLLGSAPSPLLASGRRTPQFYNPNGVLKGHSPRQDAIKFENSVNTVKSEEKRRFLHFAQRMITWDPRERSTARELLQDAWLHTDFTQT